MRTVKRWECADQLWRFARDLQGLSVLKSGKSQAHGDELVPWFEEATIEMVHTHTHAHTYTHITHNTKCTHTHIKHTTHTHALHTTRLTHNTLAHIHMYH